MFQKWHFKYSFFCFHMGKKKKILETTKSDSNSIYHYLISEKKSSDNFYYEYLVNYIKKLFLMKVPLTSLFGLLTGSLKLTF